MVHQFSVILLWKIACFCAFPVSYKGKYLFFPRLKYNKMKKGLSKNEENEWKMLFGIKEEMKDGKKMKERCGGGGGGGVCPEKESKGNGESRSYFSIKEKLTVQQEQKSVF